MIASVLALCIQGAGAGSAGHRYRQVGL